MRNNKTLNTLLKVNNIVFAVVVIFGRGYQWASIISSALWVITTIALIVNDRKNKIFDFITVIYAAIALFIVLTYIPGFTDLIGL